MNKFRLSVLIGISTFVLGSCSADTSSIENDNAEEFARLKSENRILESQLSEKDSVINESILLFNEIEDNLAKINLKEDEIRYKSKDVELAIDGKEWILQEIQNINYLREDNQKKVKALNRQLRNNGNKLTALTALTIKLNEKIEIQDEEIELLRTELSDLDKEYVELLEAYHEQSTLATETIIELNSVYYAYGTYDELEKNGVLIKEGGFIGIGKKTGFHDNFNDDYFTKVDFTNTKQIEIEGGEEVKLISDHSSKSYHIVSKGSNHTLVIDNARNFWKVSKYLVVVVK